MMSLKQSARVTRSFLGLLSLTFLLVIPETGFAAKIHKAALKGKVSKVEKILAKSPSRPHSDR